jgi:hypothetical protein
MEIGMEMEIEIGRNYAYAGSPQKAKPYGCTPAMISLTYWDL